RYRLRGYGTWQPLADAQPVREHVSALVAAGYTITSIAAASDTYVIHDYTEHQRSASEVADLREKRAAAGRRGGKRSGESRRA
ncbi:hypothetical protein KBZ21_40320, partial [Streptomyces sp. A73]|nr:hypothetical protein [Streptomyces sp. A73]